jgi:hypothetical protein
MNKLKALINDPATDPEVRKVACFIRDYGDEFDLKAAREVLEEYEALHDPIDAHSLFHRVAKEVYRGVYRRYLKLSKKHKACL